jgi:hypothetical protein
MAYFCNNKLNIFIKTKDQLLHTQKNNVIYKIPRSECDATYVGQTKRQLNTRIKKHSRNINKNSESLTVISEHRNRT